MTKFRNLLNESSISINSKLSGVFITSKSVVEIPMVISTPKGNIYISSKGDIYKENEITSIEVYTQDVVNDLRELIDDPKVINFSVHNGFRMNPGRDSNEDAYDLSAYDMFLKRAEAYIKSTQKRYFTVKIQGRQFHVRPKI